ncbi:hypothetical protein HNR23_002467 [Nocardiopsis mwathae]|uniref:ATP-grasp domain-containing protein n=1 Tax=Nocardiopsis mwathae TaxID=1472723 RepID=A0A7W9YHU6_9ACTN|nr:hypothetical protein [Nocardiopsis mwathae]
MKRSAVGSWGRRITARLIDGSADVVISPDGTWTLLEVNPNGEWSWLAEACELPIAQTIANLLERGHR